MLGGLVTVAQRGREQARRIERLQHVVADRGQEARLRLLRRFGFAAAVGDALFHAHFAEGRNLADPEVLVAAGAAGGLAEARVRDLLAGDEGLAEVRTQLAQAQAMGIRAVPTFVIDGRFAVQGAQPPELFAQALRRAAAAVPGPAATPAAGEDCGPDGCRT